MIVGGWLSFTVIVNVQVATPQVLVAVAVTVVVPTGKNVPDGYDVDHTIDHQLGGRDEVSNMKPLDIAVNRSLGKQIEVQLRGLDYGAPIIGAAIC